MRFRALFNFAVRIWDAFRSGPATSAFALSITDESVSIGKSGKEVDRFSWAAVDEVVTYKRDCGTYDDVRLAFRVAEEWFDMSEDCEGWASLMDHMAVRLPGIPVDWYHDVAFPAFATNHRVLFKRV